jgi:large subunit ribosomal protein L25
MKELQLAAELRSGVGKSVTRKLRAAGTTPGVLYGLDKDPQSLGVSSQELKKLLRSSGENVLVDLAVKGKKTEKVLLREVQRHPVTEDIIHVDFLRIDLTKEIEVTVPVRLVGTAEGVKAGGVLEFVRREIRVSCLPTNIPDHVDADVSALNINEAIHVSDLSVADAEILTDAARTIVVVHPPVVAKVTEEVAEGAEVEAEAEEESAEPEVISEKKKEEEEE